MTAFKRRIISMLGIAILLVASSLVGTESAYARSYSVHRHCYWNHHQRHCYYHRHYYRGHHSHYYRHYYRNRPGWNSK